MSHRIHLAWNHDRDLPRAAALQKKLIEVLRRQADSALALPVVAPLDAHQRNSVRSLGVELNQLGVILFEQGNPDCVVAYEESVRHSQRAQNTGMEAMSRREIGHAYLGIPAIRDLDAAEAAYQRSLALREPSDPLGRARCLFSIGDVHYTRFNESRKRGEPAEAMLKHAQRAEQQFLKALALCPHTALPDLGLMHKHLGNLYHALGQIEPARKHYEEAAQHLDKTGNHYYAGGVRSNIAVMYLDAAGREAALSRQRDFLHRAQAYAQAALRDLQQYQGRAAADEVKAQQLLADIAQALTKLPD